ncbi:MAG: thioredoxin fold domain-containing protein [Pseudomonadales bacterium]
MKVYAYAVLLAALFPASIHALEPAEIKELLESHVPELQVIEVREGAVAGLYEVDLMPPQTIFVSKDGEHIIAGDLFRIMGPSAILNLSEQRRTARTAELDKFRKDALAGFDESKMVVFSPAKDEVKTTVTVFTDTTCGFCRKLHRDVPELNRLGIAVRYMAWPRGGINSAGYDVMVSAWCADDPARALTLAKLGKNIDPVTCDSPVEEEYKLGQQFGVDATPALVFEDGSMVKGYRDAKTLAQSLGIPYVET